MIAPPRLTPWMIVVMIMAGVGICLLGWMSFHSLAAGPSPLPPLVVKPLPPRVRRDAVDAFDRLTSRGMSADQLGWIVDDLEKAGLLDEETGESLPEGILEWREKRWYLEALASGLGLDQAQRDEAQAKLAALPEESGDEERPFPVQPLPRTCPGWLTSPAAAPWALCHLTERQLALTGRAAWDAAAKASAGDEPPLEAAPAGSEAALAYLLPVTGLEKVAATKNGGSEQAFFQALHPAQVQLLFLISGVPGWLLDDEEGR